MPGRRSFRQPRARCCGCEPQHQARGSKAAAPTATATLRDTNRVGRRTASSRGSARGLLGGQRKLPGAHEPPRRLGGRRKRKLRVPPAEAREAQQYSLARVLGVWVAATAPMGLVGWWLHRLPVIHFRRAAVEGRSSRDWLERRGFEAMSRRSGGCRRERPLPVRRQGRRSTSRTRPPGRPR
jgi:hypothetical protein